MEHGLGDGCIRLGALLGLPIPCCNDILNVDVEAISSDDKVEIAADGLASTRLIPNQLQIDTQASGEPPPAPNSGGFRL